MKNKEIEDLEQALFRTKIFVFGVVIIIPLIYGYYLGFDSQQSLSRNGAHWGTFGDFVGGILNPIVALCAFYWLTQSVLIQKTELSTTQTILAETEKTQRYQRFENSFFSLLEQMNSVFIQLDTPDMSRTSTTNNCQVANRSKLSKLHREVFNVNSTVSISIMYIRLRDNSADTNHYFRIIYQLLQFILKNSTGEYNDKISFNSLLLTKVTNAEKFYANIVRSFLSKEVTQLIAINCIDSTKIPYNNMGEGQSGYPQYQDYKKFRALIERYSLLEHITNINEFPDITDYYDKSAFGNNINVEK